MTHGAFTPLPVIATLTLVQREGWEGWRRSLPCSVGLAQCRLLVLLGICGAHRWEHSWPPGKGEPRKRAQRKAGDLLGTPPAWHRCSQAEAFSSFWSPSFWVPFVRLKTLTRKQRKGIGVNEAKFMADF